MRCCAYLYYSFFGVPVGWHAASELRLFQNDGGVVRSLVLLDSMSNFKVKLL